jgi:hypothetical protein
MRTEFHADAVAWASACADAASVIEVIDYVISSNPNAEPGELIPVIKEVILDWRDLPKPKPLVKHRLLSAKEIRLGMWLAYWLLAVLMLGVFSR